MFAVSPKIIFLSESQNHRCAYCGIVMVLDDQSSMDAVSTDHVIPVSLGGHRVRDNEVAACRLCNGGRGKLNAEVYFNMVRRHGRAAAPQVAKQMRSQIAQRDRPAANYGAAPPLQLAREAQEEARRKWVAAIQATEAARKKAIDARRGDLVARSVSGAVVAVFKRKLPMVAPHGRPKDCDFDPALRPVALIPKPPKREEPIPLERMSKRHRRQVKIAADARAPFMTA